MLLLKSLSLALVLSAALLSGCASFEKKELERVDAFASSTQQALKPTIYVDVHSYRGEPGGKAKELPGGASTLRPAIENALNHSDMFSSYSFDAAQGAGADYTLRIDAYNHGNAVGAAVMGFICGYSLGIIPAAATDNYTLNFQARDNRGGVLKEYTNKDSVTTWMGLWFIPVMGNTPKKAIDSTIENQVRLALRTLTEEGTFQHSPSQTPISASGF